MKGKFNNIACLALVLFMAMASTCKNGHDGHPMEHEQHTDTTYTCPMHPDVISDQPGQCPQCNMNLVPLVNDTLLQTISPGKQVLSRQATVTLQPGTNENSIQAHGIIDLDQNRNQSVSARFGGRIEKLYVKFNLQYVRQGTRIMELYSPVLRTMQEEHLFLIRSEANDTLVERSREKLRLLGITKQQITQLETSGTVTSTVSVFSPSNGYVFFTAQTTAEDNSSATASTGKSMGMQQDGMKTTTFGSSASQIREGMYVNEGQLLFSINDLQQVWAVVSVPNASLGQIRENQPVVIIPETNTSKPLTGKISLLEQIFEENKQRFARIRIVLPNRDNALKLNTLVTANITVDGNKGFQVPTSAVFRTGLNTYVWVKTGTTKSGTGIFQLRKVIARAGNNGMTSIISGLEPHEEIAKEAGFMTDSETFLTVN